MPDILRDIRDAFRSARRQLGVTLVIVLTLAVGIGASTAIFTYFEELYWHQLDAPDAERMYEVFTGTAKQPLGRTSYLDASLYREALADLGELAPWGHVWSVALTVPEEGSGPGKTVLSNGSAVSPEHFDFFGVDFFLGRDFLPEEHHSDGPPVAVIDYTFWSRHMGADPAVLGRPLRLNGHTFTVVGVTPRGFENTGWPYAVYVPTARYGDLTKALLLDREARRFACLLRLKQGVQPAEAEARLALVATNLDGEHPWPEGAERHITVRRINSESLDLQTADMMLAGAVGLLLLLACANVANLLLARAAGRQREIAVHAALGASQGRIARRLLTESSLLALAGGSLGLLFARWLLAVIRPYHEKMAFGYASYAEGGEEWIQYDDRVLGFTLLVTLVTGCLFGLAPILHAARTDLVSALKSGGAEAKPGRRLGARQLLVILQVTLATTLLLLAGLLMRSLQGLQNRELGFETEHQLMAALVATPPPGDSAAERREAWRDLYETGRQRLAELPGIESATLTTAIPGTRKRSGGHVVLPRQPDQKFFVDLHQIGPDFFETFGMSLVRGRSFDLRDRAGATGAAIVNQTFADRFFTDVDPIGQDLLWPDLETDAAEGRFRVVGVVPDFRHRSRLAEPTPLVYLPLSQYLRPRFRARLEAVVRTSGPPQAAMRSVRQALATAHPGLAVTELGTYEGITADLLDPKLHSVLSGLFSFFGLALACLGIYGVMSCSVSYRFRELGIRMALGATARDLIRLVLAEAFRLTVAGVLCGVAMALALTRLISSLLYGVSSADPLTFLTLPLVLAVVGLAAAWLPAWQAGRVDPKVVLQEE
jgi:putative ABC transport system permease protein